MRRARAKVINKSDIMRTIHMKGPVGFLLSAWLMHFLGFNKVNKCYDRCHHATGPDFSDLTLRDIKVSYSLKPQQLDYIPQEGPFITISNHPFGGVDGLMLSAIVGTMRPDLKILSNFLLSMIPTLKDTFLPVNPFSEGTSNRKSFTGIRMAKEHVAAGGCLGLFPAGEVATYQRPKKRISLKKGRVIEDIPWPENMIKFIKTANVPVVPIYFEGTNSKIFHMLGRIHPMLRTLRLPRELFTKRGKVFPVRIGKPIMPSEMDDYDNLKDLGGYLRSRVYALQSDLENENESLINPIGGPVPIALPKDKKAIIKEFEKIASKKLFEVASYQGFLANYEDIPNIIHEIGRRREESFRATGEGTNLPLDLDDYDKYYKHLILWDKNRKKIAGAYRLGIGQEIYEKHGGIDGFYTHNLFKYSAQFDETLKQVIELGRSFVSVEYQKEALPLMLLIKGLMHSVMFYPDAKYFIGPVSISNSYPRFYQSLMVYYLSNNCSLEEVKSMVSPRTPFVADYLRLNPSMLLSHKMDTFEKFDRFLLRLSDGEYRIPTLVKKYIKINSRIVCFNVDPLFNYSLDGLIVLKLTDFPKRELLMMTKDLSDKKEVEAILNRFEYCSKETTN